MTSEDPREKQRVHCTDKCHEPNEYMQKVANETSMILRSCLHDHLTTNIILRQMGIEHASLQRKLSFISLADVVAHRESFKIAGPEDPIFLQHKSRSTLSNKELINADKVCW